MAVKLIDTQDLPFGQVAAIPMDKFQAAHLAVAMVVMGIKEEITPLIDLTRTMMAYMLPLIFGVN